MFENVIKMLSRVHPNSLRNAIWVCSPTCLPQLLSMQFSVRDSSAEVVGGDRIPLNAEGAPVGAYRLMGLPLVLSEALPIIGDAGDILLCDFSQYAYGLRSDASIAVSTHAKFTEDKVTYRLIIRCDGASKWNAPMTPLLGDTLAPAVTLAAR